MSHTSGPCTQLQNKARRSRRQFLSTPLPPAVPPGRLLPSLQTLTPRRYRRPGYQVPPHLSPKAQAPQLHYQQPDGPVWGHGTRPGSELQASCPAGGKERVRVTSRENRPEGGPHKLGQEALRTDLTRPPWGSPHCPSPGSRDLVPSHTWPLPHSFQRTKGSP